MKTTRDNFTDLLSPSPVEFSFDTIGWRVLGVIVLLLILSIIAWILYRYQKNRYRSEALKLISHIHTKGHTRLIQTDKILRRTAFTAYKDPQIKSMNYNMWKDFLLQHAPPYSEDTDFLSNIGEIVYQKDEKTDDILISKFVKYARFWIRKHEF
ncbi:DUF4381 domain-containing protein [Halosquirtibacter xylanolyticus]|uniref:DUF4381 domain-containing protein n=1 Tax=Halosquirtibacter xylanolyticus TaxID=3374599 RepID=UPI0037481362|nr:DUF4381 domain-containing protein [Prolixibacteraceae bacterium]